MRSVYIHVPFCRKICTYCDFCKVLYTDDLVDKYLIALEKEIIKRYNHEKLQTIYIGGGTPSCLSLTQLNKLLGLLSKFNMSENCEITIEFNIEDITLEKLILVKQYNINRISIGIQTLNSKFFNLLGRTNNKEEVASKIKLCKSFFENINIDLMYGFNNQTQADLDQDIDYFLKLNIPHISLYSLILEKHTKLFIDKYISLDEDIESSMYHHIIKRLKDNGFKHYEISNFSKEGYSSAHNKVYWHNDEYYGFGLGASSYKENKRSTNTRSITKYLRGDYSYYEEELSIDDIMNYQVILNLRLTEGINKDIFYNKFGKKILECYNYSSLIQSGLLEEDETSVWIKEENLYISNSIILKFLDNKVF